MSVESGGKTEMNKAIREEEWTVVSRKCKENNASEHSAHIVETIVQSKGLTEGESSKETLEDTCLGVQNLKMHD